jgi:hypothetical protein
MQLPDRGDRCRCSSGVESAPGRKDPALIAAFIAACGMPSDRQNAGPAEFVEVSVNALHSPNTYRAGPDERGYFGLYGGRFVAETLMPLVLDLEQAYETAKADPAYAAELTHLGTHYTGRPSPLYYAERLTEHLRQNAGEGRGAKVYFKRDELNHTGFAQDQQLPWPNSCWPAAWARPHHRETGAGQHGVPPRRSAPASACPASSIWAPPMWSGRSRTSFA